MSIPASKPILIGLVGLSGSGKDTAAQALIDTLGFHRVAYADPIRAGLKAMFRSIVPNSHIWWTTTHKDTLAVCGKTPRQLLRTLGTEWGRVHVGPGIWALIAETTVRAKLTAGDSVVVTDIRTPIDGLMIIRNGGTLVHIHRAPLVARTWWRLSRRPAIHSSEAAVASTANLATYRLHNNKSIKDLQRNMLDVAASINPVRV